MDEQTKTVFLLLTKAINDLTKLVENWGVEAAPPSATTGLLSVSDPGQILSSVRTTLSKALDELGVPNG
jgi:hypothetical protein